MRKRLRGQAEALLCFALVVFTHTSIAAVTRIKPGSDSLQRAIAHAQPGDTIILKPGNYAGPIVIDRQLVLEGRGASIIDGGGRGRVLTIAAPDVAVRNLVIRHSGADLSTEDSGIFVTADGDRAVLEDNRLEQNLIGIYLKGPDAAVVRANEITGRSDLHMSERGNAIHLWNTPGSVVQGNRIQSGRDGIFVTTSHNNKFMSNRFSDLRFAIHYMYTNDSEVSGNISHGNHVGYALMYSTRLAVHDNLSDGDRDRGLFFNYTNNSRVTGNVVRSAEKCVFIYNSNFNVIHGNEFEYCQIGVHFTAGSEQNVLAGNAFITNRTQVKYVGTRYLEWSADGRGNYWSDNTAFDLNSDGIADRPYRPNSIVDKIVWRHPAAKVLLNSPALQLLRWAQSQFPAIHPGGVVDSAPLMQPP